MYIEEVLPGFNFISLEGNIGGFTNPRMEKLGIKKFVLLLRHQKDQESSDGRLLSDFAHLIELPEWFTDKVRAADKLKGEEWRQLIQRALPAAPSK